MTYIDWLRKCPTFDFFNEGGCKIGINYSKGSQVKTYTHLIDAGFSTNFKYKVLGDLSDDVLRGINDADLSLKEKVSKVYANSCVLEFEVIPNIIFSNNTVLIDSSLPQILANMLLNSYKGSSTKTIDLLKTIKRTNPFGFNINSSRPFYEYKLKRFFTDAALGMTPSKVWDGKYDATGGYLIVKDDGDVLCYHIYNQNEFESYLIENTKFETASTTRYEFGGIYKENGSLYMNLNLQIRFIK